MNYKKIFQSFWQIMPIKLSFKSWGNLQKSSHKKKLTVFIVFDYAIGSMSIFYLTKYCDCESNICLAIYWVLSLPFTLAAKNKSYLASLSKINKQIFIVQHKVDICSFFFNRTNSMIFKCSGAVSQWKAKYILFYKW